ncbi:MAG TPA: FtsX-like permease family protein [Ignavibacteria bacterium]|nr:FtsX-like permease family protein [Ignavibacteria bacterium]
MIIDYFLLAFNNLKHRGLRSWLTLLGIIIGVTAVVALISLGTGLKLAVSSQFGISTTEIITVQAGGVSGFGPPGSNVANSLTLDDVKAIEKLSDVKRALSRNMVSAKLEYNKKVIFGHIGNILNGDNRKFIYKMLKFKAEKGQLLKDSDVRKVFLGYNFYVDKMGFGKDIIPGKKILINDKKFEVAGILDKKGSIIFDNMVFMNEDDMQNLFGYKDKVNIIIVQVRDKSNLEKTKEEIKKLMRERRNVKIGEEDFSVSTPEAIMATVNNILKGVQIFIVLIASISIFIGGLGIVNTMTTSVLERKKEIGIMKSIGAKNSQIFFQFFIESGLLGLIGGILGAFFGVVIGILGTNALNNFLGATLEPVIDYMLIFYALLGSFIIGALAGIIPAMNAARQNPVEALRG